MSWGEPRLAGRVHSGHPRPDWRRALRTAASLGAPGLLLSGCLDALLEGPYVLTSGLGEARSVSPGPLDGMLVATERGLFSVSGSGEATELFREPARAVTAHRSTVYLLTDAHQVLVAPASALTAWSEAVVAPGAVDLQAWCDDELVVAWPDRLASWHVAEQRWTSVAEGLQGVVAVALGPTCSEVLVVTPTRLLGVGRGGQRTLAAGLVDARAAAIDRRGQVWVVQGADPELDRVTASGVETFARYLGQPRDLHFGTGGLLLPENAYLADADGTLDYVRVVPE